MKKIVLVTALTAFCLAFWTVSAAAQDQVGERRGMFRQKMMERLEKIDIDGDGAITRAEFLAEAEDKFAKLDADGDGVFTAEERAALRERARQVGEGTGGEQFP